MTLRLPNLLATSRGRLIAFFLLYVTEGIPLGFAATAVATQLRRLDVGPAEIGAFVASFYLPWAFKWMFGPVIDVFASKRFGHRRGWILITQVLMAVTLLSTVLLDLPQQLGLFTLILLVHNTFAAMQDVAIDALAVNTLHDQERGLANGMMFAGATIGTMVGGSGVLFLGSVTGFQPTFYFVTLCILAVTVFVVLPMKEAPDLTRTLANAAAQGSRMVQAGREMRAFSINSFRSFLGSPGAFSGVWFSLLPAGAMSLGLTLQSNLAVELGLNDDQVAVMGVWSGLLGAAFCILGGHWSDRFGRRRTLAIYMVLMTLPVFYLMFEVSRYGWIMPVSPTLPNRPAVPPELVTALWIASLTYAVFQGLMYGTRTAIMMDVTNPKVAATQFTAYMAMMNLAIAFAATWQGIAVEAWGYPVTLAIDGVTGVICLLCLPWLKRMEASAANFADQLAPRRARGMALALSLLCFAWWPYSLYSDAFGAAQPIMGTIFTLIFVASALFLMAGHSVLEKSGSWAARFRPWLAPLLLLMYLRYHLDTIAGWLSTFLSVDAFNLGAQVGLILIALVASALLFRMSRQTWREMVPAQG